MSNTDLVNLLKQSIPSGFDLMSRLKVIYRPYLTPFKDLLELIPENASVFDIGCGNGAFLYLIKLLKQPKNIGGIEISDELINNANDLLDAKNANLNMSIKLEVFDGINIPDLVDFDYVFMIDVLHHIPIPIRHDFFKSLKLAMKKDAILILKDIDAGHRILTMANKLHDRVISGETGNEVSISVAQQMLLSHGFAIDSMTYKRMLWYPHYTIVAKAS